MHGWGGYHSRVASRHRRREWQLRDGWRWLAAHQQALIAAWVTLCLLLMFVLLG